jgi:hypothetical protein
VDDRPERAAYSSERHQPGTIDTPGLNDLLESSGAGDTRRKMISDAELFVDGGIAQV